MADLKGFNSKRHEQGRSHKTDKIADALAHADNPLDTLGLKNPAFWYSGGFIIAFVLMAIFAEERLAKLINIGFSWSATVFGPFWQILLLATFVIALAVGAGRTGRHAAGAAPRVGLPV